MLTKDLSLFIFFCLPVGSTSWVVSEGTAGLATTSFPNCARMTNIHLWLNLSFYRDMTISHTTVRGRDFLWSTINLTDKQINNWRMCVFMWRKDSLVELARPDTFQVLAWVTRCKHWGLQLIFSLVLNGFHWPRNASGWGIIYRSFCCTV